MFTRPERRSNTFAFIVTGFLSAVVGGSVSAALVDGLELYYSYDNDTIAPGGIHDGSGNGRNGSGFDKDLGGVDIVFSNDVPAALGGGKSLDLSGTTDFVISDTPGFLGVTGTGSRTFATWVKLTDIAFATTLIEWGQNVSGGRWAMRVNFAINQGPTWTLRTEVQDGFMIGDDSIQGGGWHHLAATLESNGTPDMADVKLYVDGVLQNITALGPQPIDTLAGSNVTIGGSTAFPAEARSVLGLLDDTAIWSRALSAQEIADLAAGDPIPEPSSMIALVLGGACLGRRRRH